MNLNNVISYCLAKPGAWSDLPFDEHTLVIKVATRMFCLIGSENSDRINLKCDPLKALDLRQKYKFILPGYHMNKKHWITVILDNDLEPELLKELIDNSYDLVFRNLTRNEQRNIRE